MLKYFKLSNFKPVLLGFALFCFPYIMGICIFLFLLITKPTELTDFKIADSYEFLSIKSNILVITSMSIGLIFSLFLTFIKKDWKKCSIFFRIGVALLIFFGTFFIHENFLFPYFFPDTPTDGSILMIWPAFLITGSLLFYLIEIRGDNFFVLK